jgi:hypothetical protein
LTLPEPLLLILQKRIANMKTFSGIAAAGLLILPCYGEIFIGSSNQVNSLVVASNETIIISAALDSGDDVGGFPANLSVNGTLQKFRFDTYLNKPVEIAGPATLTFPSDPPTNSLPVMISFQRVKARGIHSIYIPSDGTSMAIDVPVGKTCFFAPAIADNNGGLPVLRLSVQTTNGILSNLPSYGGQQFSGPASLLVSFQGCGCGYGGGAVVTYYINTRRSAVVGF